MDPWSEDPIQIYEMPEQRRGDNKLSLMTRHDVRSNLQSLHRHQVFEDDLEIPNSLRHRYTVCRLCGKAVPNSEMDSPCLFHHGQSTSQAGKLLS